MDLYGQLVGKHTIPMDSTGYDMSPTAIDWDIRAYIPFLHTMHRGMEIMELSTQIDM